MPRNNLIFRFKFLKYILLTLFAVILVRLFFIQIIDHDTYVAKANKQHTSKITITARRGEIYMMDKGEPVAVVLNQTKYFIAIDPTVTKREVAEKVLEEYAKDYTTDNLDVAYNTEGLRYAIIAKNMPRELAEKIIEADFSGIWVKKSNHRVYPEGELASGLLGFVNDEDKGQYGVEGSLNELLAGENGELKTVTDINKVALSIGNNNVKKPAKDGKNLVLSIDRGLQRGVEDLVSETLTSSIATNAAVLIMDPNSGEILVMARLPGYDIANYNQVEDATVYLNQITDIPYEPASVCKSFTFSAAINEGLMNGETTYFNQGYEIVDDYQIDNAEKRASLYGTVNMRTAFYWSLNTGSIYALKLLGGDTSRINQVGREKLYDYYYNKFRLGRPTGIEIDEAKGYIQDPNNGWGRDSVYANMTFGQNLGVTMLQTATAFSAVVNGGYYLTPTIVKGAIENGELIDLNLSEKVKEQILDEETSRLMREFLINNRSYKVRQGIDRSGYSIGGKTGTAQVVKNGSYDNTMSETIGNYLGFVGTDGELPKYVIMVKMWGEGQAVEGNHANELFDKLSNYLIDYLKIKPKE